MEADRGAGIPGCLRLGEAGREGFNDFRMLKFELRGGIDGFDLRGNPELPRQRRLGEGLFVLMPPAGLFISAGRSVLTYCPCTCKSVNALPVFAGNYQLSPVPAWVKVKNVEGPSFQPPIQKCSKINRLPL